MRRWQPLMSAKEAQQIANAIEGMIGAQAVDFRDRKNIAEQAKVALIELLMGLATEGRTDQ